MSAATESIVTTTAQAQQAALNEKIYMNVVDQGTGGITMDMIRFDTSQLPGVVYYELHSQSGSLDAKILKTVSCDE